MSDRACARTLARQYVTADLPLDWFEVLYQEAAAGSAVVPWADLQPNPNLVDWLDRTATDGHNRQALVIGSGYGDDAEELARRGFSVTAFDISSTAIHRSRERFPDSSVSYEIANFLKPPANWHRRFDFVFEAYTWQVLPPDLRASAVRKTAELVASNGTLLVVTRARDATDPAGQMPWPLLREELALLTTSLHEVAFEDFFDNEQPPVRRFRAEYRRDEGGNP
ncbi:methyltransferase domain-containing protein [bacterium]|nr:methyltransferase domain-containing protein [bacterium]